MNDVDIDGGRLTARNAGVGLHSGQSLRLPMSTESQLREKLRKIEALFAGAGTAGERLAAEAALERVRARLGELSRQDRIPPPQAALFGDRFPTKHAALRLALRSVDAGRSSG